MRLPTLFRSEQRIENDFHVSIYIVVYKFLLGLFELLAGISLGLFGSQIYQVIQRDLLEELSEDPHALVAGILERTLPNVFNHSTFVILALIILGLAKVAGAVGLIYKRNWGADLLVGLTVLMAPFQIVSLILHPNLFDLLYLVVGLVIAFYLVGFRARAWISRMLNSH